MEVGTQYQAAPGCDLDKSLPLSTHYWDLLRVKTEDICWHLELINLSSTLPMSDCPFLSEISRLLSPLTPNSYNMSCVAFWPMVCLLGDVA